MAGTERCVRSLGRLSSSTETMQSAPGKVSHRERSGLNPVRHSERVMSRRSGSREPGMVVSASCRAAATPSSSQQLGPRPEEREFTLRLCMSFLTTFSTRFCACCQGAKGCGPGCWAALMAPVWRRAPGCQGALRPGLSGSKGRAAQVAGRH